MPPGTIISPYLYLSKSRNLLCYKNITMSVKYLTIYLRYLITREQYSPRRARATNKRFNEARGYAPTCCKSDTPAKASLMEGEIPRSYTALDSGEVQIKILRKEFLQWQNIWRLQTANRIPGAYDSAGKVIPAMIGCAPPDKNLS